jgi:hypothetical protein
MPPTALSQMIATSMIRERCNGLCRQPIVVMPPSAMAAPASTLTSTFLTAYF